MCAHVCVCMCVCVCVCVRARVCAYAYMRVGIIMSIIISKIIIPELC